MNTIIPTEKVNVWFDRGLNVLLMGPHGVGKTSVIVQECEKRKKTVAYFSASTLDPWIDLIGIPRPVDTEVGSYIDLIRPELFQNDKIDVIIFDELNRSPKKVRNAIMELIQFRSINGKKFHKLKMVIGIINPQDEKETYDVEPMDPAQIDRFHIQYNMPTAPHEPWFVQKFGNNGKVACDFWFNIPVELRGLCSPRRLDYCLEMAEAGHKDMIVDMLDQSVHPEKLIGLLDSMSIVDQLEELLNSTPAKRKKWINDPNNFDNSIETITGNQRYMDAFMPLVHGERLMAIARSTDIVMKELCQKYEQEKAYEKCLSDIGDQIVADHERETAAAAAATT
jgi:hypothetical protein